VISAGLAYLYPWPATRLLSCLSFGGTEAEAHPHHMGVELGRERARGPACTIIGHRRRRGLPAMWVAPACLPACVHYAAARLVHVSKG